MLLKLVEDSQSDIVHIARALGISTTPLVRALRHGLELRRAGNTGKPVFSPLLIAWLQDAWLVASVEGEARRLRSGHLLSVLLQRPEAYEAADYADALAAFDRDAVRRRLDELAEGIRRTADGPGRDHAGRTPARAGPCRCPRRRRTGRGRPPLRQRPRPVTPLDFTAARARRPDRSDLRPRARDPADDRHPRPPPEEQPHHRRRLRRRQDRARRGAGAPHRARATSPTRCKNVEIRGLDLGLLQAGAGVKGEFENRLKRRHRRGEGLGQADHPLHRRGPHHHRRRRRAGRRRRGQPAQARARPRRAAHHRGHHLDRVQEILREGRRARAPLPARQGRRAVPRRRPSPCSAASRAQASRRRTASIIRDEAVIAAVRLSARYISGRQLPDKAVDLLDTCARARQGRPPAEPAADRGRRGRCISDVTAELEALAPRRRRGRARRRRAHRRDRGASAPRPRDELVRPLEAALQRAQTAVATPTSTRRASRWPPAKTERRARRACAPRSSRALDALDESQGDVPLVRPDVDEQMVATVVAAWTGIPVGKMVQDDVEALLEMEDAPRAAASRARTTASTPSPTSCAPRAPASSRPSTPQGVFLLVGPSGVGKTETALSHRRPDLRRRALDDHHQHVRVPGEAHRLPAHRLAARLRRLRRGRHAHRGGAPAPLHRRAPRRGREGRPRRAQPLLPGVRQGHALRRRGPRSSTSRTPSSS